MTCTFDVSSLQVCIEGFMAHGINACAFRGRRTKTDSHESLTGICLCQQPCISLRCGQWSKTLSALPSYVLKFAKQKQQWGNWGNVFFAIFSDV